MRCFLFRWLRLFLSIIAFWLAAVPSARCQTHWVIGKAAKVCELVDSYGRGTVQNSMASEASPTETCGGQSAPGIFLHPLEEGEATWSLSLRLPPINPDEKLIFLGLVGLRDGIPWNDPSKPKCDGVDFRMKIEGITAVASSVVGPGWVPIACDLTQFRGRDVEILLSTSARGDPNYDWAVFGRPEILLLSNERYATEEEISRGRLRFTSEMQGAEAVAVVEVIEPSSPVALMASRETIELASGASGIPVEMGWIARRFTPPAGTETIRIAHLAGVPRQCSVYHLVPTLEIEEFGPVTAFPVLGKNIFGLRITNKGPGHYRPGGEPLEIQIRDATDTVGESEETYRTEGPPEIAPGESVVLRRGPFQISNPSKSLYAVLRGQSISAWKPAMFYTTPESGAAALTCGDYRVSFPRSGNLYPAAIIEHKDPKSAQLRRVGTITPLASASYMDRAGHHTWHLITSSVEWMGERELVISQALGELKLSVRFTSDPDQLLIRFLATLEISAGEMQVYHFSGPRVAFGDGSFGRDHGHALFPGLEYLGPEDSSSSELDASGPIRLRHAPDPIKITIPLMAVEHGTDLTCMFWDTHQEWQPGYTMPGAWFNVPPAGDLEEYSSFSLYVPPPPEWRPENAKLATKPVVITPDRPLTLKGAVYLEHAGNPKRPRITETDLDGEFIFTALGKYIKTFGLPQVMDPPRDWQAEKALSREAWFSTIWVPEAKGWRHAVGQQWQPAPAPGMATLLLFDSLDTTDPEIRILLRDRIAEAIGTAIEKRGPEYLSSGENCHIMRGEYPFYGGYLRQSLERWMAAGLDIIKEQRKDGSWGWQPGSNPRQQNLGKPGQATSGTCAGSAWFLLKLGRILGDDRFVQAGLRGLRALERFRVPRGAQGWECPLHAPDILASGYAVRANVEAYRATDNPQYLDQARYWAWSGLPFVYFWNTESIPSMRFNTIPIFGATFYTHSWLGRPVIWCGLVYAYALQELATLDGEFDWKQIAKGITRSAMWQQYELDHKSKGCYPDSYDLRANRRNPADINPEDIMVNAFALRGLDPGIKTVRFAMNNDVITVSSGARIEPIAGEEGLAMALSFFQGETVHTLLSPMRRVNRVLIGKRELPRVENTDKVPEGYQVFEDLGWLIVKNRFDQARIELRIY